MKKNTGKDFFIISAAVAGELFQAMRVAEKIALASSNAGVLAFRAGERAAGFGALTGFLAELSKKTGTMANGINQRAIKISQMSSNFLRTDSTIKQMQKVMRDAKDAPYIDSLQMPLENIQESTAREQILFNQEVNKLYSQLLDLKKELESAKIIATMSLVESSQADKEYRAALTDNAVKISDAAKQIETHVDNALALFR
ncbi:hypothetical protein [Glaciecola sp. 1036]|uniref:hypothetical protein n=1 Tax=Alteromonadaceae TaxID=72275 RepID=UPI003CFBD657